MIAVRRAGVKPQGKDTWSADQLKRVSDWIKRQGLAAPSAEEVRLAGAEYMTVPSRRVIRAARGDIAPGAARAATIVEAFFPELKATEATLLEPLGVARPRCRPPCVGPSQRRGGGDWPS